MVVRDLVQLWVGQTSDSESTRRVYLLNVKGFDEWVKARFGLDIREIPDRWREAKYAGVADGERVLDGIEGVLKMCFVHLEGKGDACTPLGLSKPANIIENRLDGKTGNGYC